MIKKSIFKLQMSAVSKNDKKISHISKISNEINKLFKFFIRFSNKLIFDIFIFSLFFYRIFYQSYCYIFLFSLYNPYSYVFTITL